MSALLPYTGVVGIALTALGFVIAYFGYVTKTAVRLALIERQCTECSADNLSAKLDTLIADNATFWKILNPHLGAIIHSPIHVDRDALMDKYEAKTITSEELPLLARLLRMMLSEPRLDPLERLAGALVLAQVEIQIRRVKESAGG